MGRYSWQDLLFRYLTLTILPGNGNFNLLKRIRMDINKTLRYFSGVILLAVGLLTLFLSTSTIFDLFDIRATQGNYILFILWANLICSILYLFSVYGFFKARKWTTFLMGLATLILIVTFFALNAYINKGGVYDTKTLGAMTFRTALTLIITFVAYFTIQKKRIKRLVK